MGLNHSFIESSILLSTDQKIFTIYIGKCARKCYNSYTNALETKKQQQQKNNPKPKLETSAVYLSKEQQQQKRSRKTTVVASKPLQGFPLAQLVLFCAWDSLEFIPHYNNYCKPSDICKRTFGAFLQRGWLLSTF